MPNPIFLGFDAGRKKDLSVIDVGEKIGDVVWDRLRIEMQTRLLRAGEELYRLLRLRSAPRLHRRSGLGMQLAERAANISAKIGQSPSPPGQEHWPINCARLEDQKLRIVAMTNCATTSAAFARRSPKAAYPFRRRERRQPLRPLWAKALRQRPRSPPDCVGAAVRDRFGSRLQPGAR